jgi:hypothetical protein
MAFVVTAVTATEAAIAAVSISSVATAVASVGAAMTVVGTITKSKELVGVGKVLGIAGGVTSLVNGAVTGLTAATAEGATSGAVDAFGADAAASGAADALSGTAASTGASGIADAAQSAVGKFDLASPNFGVDTSVMKGVSEPFASGATDFSGAVKAATPSLAPAAGQTIDDYVASLGGQGVATPAGAVGTGESSWLNDIKTKLGDKWDSLSDVTKAELLKAGLSVPGAIQKQKNEERLLDLQQQKINQTSHGSEVPVFGIIQRAQKGGA